MSEYDSRQATEAHVNRVRELIGAATGELQTRADDHDASKFFEPEKSTFDRVTPMLRGLTYGSDEYRAVMATMKPALDHHYANNRHHPEHFGGTLRGMTLFDLLEMLCDWKAAGERHADGSIDASLKHNKVRFSISDEMASVLENTAKEMGWLA